MKFKDYECPDGKTYTLSFPHGTKFPKTIKKECLCGKYKRKSCEYKMSFRNTFSKQVGYKDETLGTYFEASASPKKPSYYETDYISDRL